MTRRKTHRPRIGVSSNFMHADPERALFRGKTLQYVEARMAKAVWRAGGHPVMLMEVEDPEAIEAQALDLDGLLLTGGADVSPTSYGEDPLRPEWAGDAHRDVYEIDLLRRAEGHGAPVLGICRGIQIIAAAYGGTLYQDIDTMLDDPLVHRDWHRYDQLGHSIAVEPGSWLSDVYDGARSLGVNSIHHQSIKDVPKGFEVCATAPDGVIEAIELVEREHFVVGVQWHPEWLEAERVAEDPDAKDWADGGPIFRAFIERCKDHPKR